MRLLRCACALVFLTVGPAALTYAQADKKFPTDDEINLVLTQTERAMQQYKLLIDEEEAQLGKTAVDSVVTDRQVVEALETAVKAFKTRPQGFNGPLGFAFFEWLDDAERNALLWSNGASTQSALQIIAGNTDKATALLHLSQGCMDASTLIYTVSENAGSLYQRYAQAEEQLASQGVEVAQKCTEVLKRNGIVPPK